jgi:hypothetical protein
MAKWEGPGRYRPIRRGVVHVEGLNKALSALNRLPAEVDTEVRRASGRIAVRVQGEAKSRAGRTGYKIHRLAARSLKVKTTRDGRYDRIPTLVLGDQRILPKRGSGRKNMTRQTYNAIAAGAEFGGSRGSYAASQGKPKGGVAYYVARGRILTSTNRSRTSQFPPYLPSPSGRGGKGYFVYPAWRGLENWAMAEWSLAARLGILRA